MRKIWLPAAAAIAAAGLGPHAFAEEVPQTAPVIVVGATPTGGELNLTTTPAPVQTATAGDIQRSHAVDLTAFMTRALAGVYVNDVQNNPLQPDINYRGYTASPLLGAQQGLSVYVDGVRFNQPFGDVVSWDLIPRQAIQGMALIPGSNPLYGLNTQGGALAIRTKDGLTAPGGQLQLGYGSYDRRLAELEYGGHAHDFDWYLLGSGFKDDGWRDASPSQAGQLFGKLGWSGRRTRLALSAAYADTDLTGNGLQDQQLLAADRASIYTKPDVTKNQSALINLTFEHRIDGGPKIEGGIYWRRIKTRTLNGDLNDDALGENVYQPTAAEQAALTAAGYSGFPTSGENAANTPFPSWRCIANALLNTEPNEKCNGLLSRTLTRQHETGASLQATFDNRLLSRENLLIVGAAFQDSQAHFLQSSQYGYLTPDRGVIGVDAFADGTQDSENATDARVDLTGRTRTLSAYVMDTLKVTPDLALTFSGRYDVQRVRNRDALTPGGGPGSLNGDYRFQRFNPAFGLTWSRARALTLYASVSNGGRAPSVIELGCADPENPCRLPNAMAGDPPLKAVKTRTFELGARGEAHDLGLTWNAGLFRADNRDDILFVADDVAGFGYFKNFGKTRREGVELGVNGQWGVLSAGANYSYTRATYQSTDTLSGAGNSTNDIGPGFDGGITVEPGDKIPSVPAHIFKAQVGWEATDRLSLSADMLASSGVYARGNENNQHQPDGVFYLGPGKTDAYAVFNLGGEFKATERLKLFLQLNNVFDAHYDTAAQLGATGFTATGAFLARPFAGPVVDGERPARSVTFYAPGAPRMVWAGVRLRFG
jgi:outer membrane receptor protein involved in Fe transport